MNIQLCGYPLLCQDAVSYGIAFLYGCGERAKTNNRISGFKRDRRTLSNKIKNVGGYIVDATREFATEHKQ